MNKQEMSTSLTHFFLVCESCISHPDPDSLFAYQSSYPFNRQVLCPMLFAQLTPLCAPSMHSPIPLPFGDYLQPAKVQNAIKVIFEECVKFVLNILI